jgi:hypothetical protein
MKLNRAGCRFWSDGNRSELRNPWSQRSLSVWRLIWGVTRNELCVRTGVGVGEESVKGGSFDHTAQSTTGRVFDQEPYWVANLRLPSWVMIQVP